jgi:1,4-dihydroxy-6-naphthoate synthase
VKHARVELGISPCPNDTFAFHGLLSGAVRPRGIDLAIELADVEQLNRRLLRGEFDAAKASFALALQATDEFGVLPVGAALGYGVGPVVLAPVQARARAAHSRPRVLAPGEHTTAALLWNRFHRRDPQFAGVVLEHVVFSAIMPALARGEADFGVCIHEGRFTYDAWGLRMVEDLGARWEEAEHCPLPLGGILARKRLAPELVDALTEAIRASIAVARAEPRAALATMRAHAQELADAVLWKHVELYVTAETECLSATGRAAIERLACSARAAGAGGAHELEILGA